MPVARFPRQDANGNFLSTLTSRYKYDSLNRLKHIGHYSGTDERSSDFQSPPSLLASYTYELDVDGKRLNSFESRGFNDTAVSFVWDYDNLGRLTEEEFINASNPSGGYVDVFEFDVVGNRTKHTRNTSGGSSRVTNYTYNANDQLTAESLVVDGATPLNTSYSYHFTQQTEKDSHDNSEDIYFRYNLQGRLYRKGIPKPPW